MSGWDKTWHVFRMIHAYKHNSNAGVFLFSPSTDTFEHKTKLKSHPILYYDRNSGNTIKIQYEKETQTKNLMKTIPWELIFCFGWRYKCEQMKWKTANPNGAHHTSKWIENWEMESFRRWWQIGLKWQEEAKSLAQSTKDKLLEPHHLKCQPTWLLRCTRQNIAVNKFSFVCFSSAMKLNLENLCGDWIKRITNSWRQFYLVQK